MKAALYARVSTRDKEQNPEVQLDQLREWCKQQGYEITKEYVDQASAADLVNRTAWAECMKAAAAKKFSALVAWKLDRPFRDTIMALTVVRQLRSRGIDIHFITQPELSVAGPAGDLLLTIYAGFAQFERDQIKERVNAGLALARKSGKVFGRPARQIDVTKVLDACQRAGKGRGRWVRAAQILSAETGKTYTRGFVHTRVKRAAEAAGMDLHDFISQEVAG